MPYVLLGMMTGVLAITATELFLKEFL